jgi:copper(I)-binding protein
MNVKLTRRQVLQSSLALGSVLALPKARACEFFTTTLRVTHPWTRVAAEDARYVVVNMKIDQVMQADRLIGVETPVAGAAEIVGDPAGSKGLNLRIQQGQELQIGEAGIELRLLKLKQPLLMARTYPMTLIFEKGGAMQAELNVDYPAN